MADGNGDLFTAALRSRDTLAGLAATSARAQTGTGVNVAAEATAADAARSGLFSEALIVAMKARFDEYKTVTQK
jgi:hypothetical protein